MGAAGITAIKDGRQLWFGDTGIVLVSNPSHSNYRGDWNLVQSPEILTLTIEDTEGITVSEPGTLALFGLGLAGLGFARRRKAA